MATRVLFPILLGLLLGASPVRAEEPLLWGHLILRTAAPIDSVAWFEALDLEGRPVAEARLEPALLRALRTLARAGYPFAEARPGSFDLEAGRLVGVVTLDPGIAPRLEGITLTGSRVTRPATVRRLAGITIGEPYTGLQDQKVKERLSRSGLFSRVGAPTLVPGSEPGAVVLELPVTEPPYTRFQGVIGVSGPDSKLTGLADLNLTNIAGTGRAAAGRWEGRGNGLTRFALHYREPWLPLVPIGLEGDLQHDVNENLYSYTKWEVTGDISWKNQWRFRIGRGGTRAVETGIDQSSQRESYLVAGIDLDRRDSALNPTGGFRLGLESRRGTKTYIPVGDSLEVRLDRTRWHVAAESYRRFGERWLGVLRTRFDYLDTPEDSLPRWDLFSVGGAVSLRGYREEQFLTPAAWLVQGEWRWLQDERGSALYFFADAGFISPPGGGGLRDTLNRFLLGSGVGVRQASRLGILGVEYGIARGEGPLDGRIHLRIDAVF